MDRRKMSGVLSGGVGNEKHVYTIIIDASID